MRKARAAYERVRVRVVRGCPLLFARLSLIQRVFTIQLTSSIKKTRGHVLPLRNSKNVVSRLAMRSLRHCGQWRRAKLLARYASGYAICFPMHLSYYLFVLFFLSTPLVR